MKSGLFISLVVVLILLNGATSFGQDTSGIKSLEPVTVRASMKKIPNMVWKGFSSYFNEAENPRWYRINKNYLAKFMIYDEQNRALFTKRGSLIYHISYGYEKSLPVELTEQIKSDYSGYEITRAIKVTEEGREIWVINLADVRHLILVRMENGEMEEVQNLQKSY